VENKTLFAVILASSVTSALAQPEFVRPRAREKLLAGCVYAIVLSKPVASSVLTLWHGNTCLGALVGLPESDRIFRWEVGFVETIGKPILVDPSEHTISLMVGGKTIATSPPFIIEH
jgi:hypothetical protein